MSQNGLDELGFYSLGLMYMSWGLGSLISPSIYKKIGTRLCLIFGGLSNTIWIFSSVIVCLKSKEADSLDSPEYKNESFWTSTPVIYYLVLNSSIVNGILNGPMWVAAISFVNECADGDQFVAYFSVFWSYYVIAQILGSVVASYVLGMFN
jgi:MFS family permease